MITAQRGEDDEFNAIAADFSDPTTPERVVTAVIEQAGRLDVLVNNADMMQESSIEDTSLDAWQRNLAVDLTAPHRSC